MELYEAIEQRRTIRVYEKPATEEQLEKIILAGTKAPSAMNRQPWEFIIIEDESIADQLAELKYQLTLKSPPPGSMDPEEIKNRAMGQKSSFRKASIVALCNIVEWERSLWLCIENMSLAAAAEGLGSGIVLYWGEEQKEAGELLGLPDDYELTAILKIGVPGEEGYLRDQNPMSGGRRPEFSWLHKNRYQKK
ncbi:nitroreductase family protein [Thermodesulfobacteriota bacterium]